MRRSSLIALVLVVLAAPLSVVHARFQPTGQSSNHLTQPPNPAQRGASSPPTIQQTTDLELAQTYAPILYFHERERYRPQPIEVMLDHARVRQTVAGVEVTIRDTISAGELADVPADAYLDLWYGQDDTSAYLNYSAHGAYYDLNGLRAAYPVTTYARVKRAPDGRVVVQYWLFYYYNDWYNKHEGDWEMIQVELDASGQPARAVYAQHHGGTVRPWDAVDTIGGTHPQAYVAFGSHATYFAGDALYPQGVDIGNARIDVYDRTGSVDPATPEVQLIAETDPAWLAFAGRWGERAFGDFSGPTGPTQKREKWIDPFIWADLQPSDAAIWYHRNVRAEIDAAPDAFTLALSDPFDADFIVERERQTIVVHDLPDPTLRYEVGLQARQSRASRLIVEWPDVPAESVTRREYDLSLAAGESTTARVCQACDFVLDIDANGDGASDRRLPPTRTSSEHTDFNPPDSVVFYLPPGQIVAGVLIALLAAVLPSGLYAFGVWRLDRYEKEPLRLLLATFLWGALPGALVAIAARFLVAGALAPIITESIKAVAIGFIFTRYRSEFDDILDGIVYGALAGIGFAMTTNLITYVLGFFFGGFDFLRASVLLNGLAFGLNEAYYGAVIGVGFGVSRWAADPPLRQTAPFLGLALAVVLHLFTDFWRDLAVGDQRWLVVVPFLATWAGIVGVIAIAILSIRKEQETIRRHLQAEVDRRTFTPNEFFYLSTPRRRAQMILRDTRRGPAEIVRAIQLQNLATQLAFRRRELALMNRDPDSDAVAADLRQRIAALRPKRPVHDNR
jgi:RsiW-degrading membrane proteinase PrsW (M82 family)